MSKADKKICIWSLSDGKPGHTNQTEGLIQALSQYREIELVKMPILSRYKALLMITLKKCMGVDQKTPHLIIGTGHRTHLSLFAYKRCYGGRIITMMSPSLPNYFFDLCFIPRHDTPPQNRKNIVLTIGAINRVTPSINQDRKKALLLIGGPSKHYSWKTSKVIQQTHQLLDSTNKQWIIAGSRRTPQDFYKSAGEAFKNVKVVASEDVSKEWLPQVIAESGEIWVTADSISMIYESITSGAKTGVLLLDAERETRVTKELFKLIEEGRVVSLDKNSVQLKTNLPVLNEADRCAKLLLQHFDL